MTFSYPLGSYTNLWCWASQFPSTPVKQKLGLKVGASRNHQKGEEDSDDHDKDDGVSKEDEVMMMMMSNSVVRRPRRRGE